MLCTCCFRGRACCVAFVVRIVSGIRAWISFADSVLGANGQHLPPTPEGLLAFSAMFRSVGTFSNYVSAIGFACNLVGVSDAACQHQLVRRAKAAVKRRQEAPRTKRFISRRLLARLMQLANQEGDSLEAMLYCVTYCFLLRCASEGFPPTFRRGGVTERSECPRGVSCVQCDSDLIRVHLASRKNAPHGETLERVCWCSSCRVTCPVHAIGAWAGTLPDGATPFSALKDWDVRANLRRRLAILGVEHHAEFGLHAFRRGHAMDLLDSGADLLTILRAGGWRSCAFAAYLQMQAVESGAVAAAQGSVICCDSGVDAQTVHSSDSEA